MNAYQFWGKGFKLLRFPGLVLGCALVAGMLLAGGCGPREPEPEPEAEAPVMPETPGIAAVPPGLPAETTAPPTIAMLELAPESTAVAVAVPPLDELTLKVLQLARRLTPPEQNPADLLAMMVAQAASGLGLEEVQTVPEFLLALGLEPGTAVGLYVDLDGIADKIASGDIPLGPVVVPEFEELGEEEMAAPEPGEGFPAPPNAMMMPEFPMDALRVAAVVQVADEEKAAAATRMLLAKGHENVEFEESELDGIVFNMHAESGAAYFIHEDRLCAGMPLDFVQAVAQRFNDPAEVRYGTEACPVDEPGELAALTFPDRMAHLLSAIQTATEQAMAQAEEGPEVFMPFGVWQNIIQAYGDVRDPAVSTLALTETKLEFFHRMDMARHPQLLELAGVPEPMEYAGRMPETTGAMLALRLTPAAKQQLMETWQAMLPPELAGGPNADQLGAMVNTVMSMIREEIVLAITGMQGFIPTAVALIEVMDGEQTRNLMPLLGMPGVPEENYSGVDIFTAPFVLPTPLQYAVDGNVFLLANDNGALKSTIDRLHAEDPVNILQMMEPPLELDVPRYSLLSIRSDLVAEAVGAVAGGAPGGPLPPVVSDVLGVFREFRVTQELMDDWQQQRLTFYFN